MSIFGYSLPPGCRTLPDEAPEPSDMDLKRQRAGKRVLRALDAKTWGDVYRALYKGTDCGVTVGVSFHSHDEPVYCNDLYKYGPKDWPIAIHISSIVEGVDACTGTEIVELDAPRAVARLWAAVKEVEAEAAAIWNETHGCDTCQAHWVSEGFGDGEIDGAVPVWDQCPDCGGHGVSI